MDNYSVEWVVMLYVLEYVCELKVFNVLFYIDLKLIEDSMM